VTREIVGQEAEQPPRPVGARKAAGSARAGHEPVAPSSASRTSGSTGFHGLIFCTP
jgi:hypothetical protein